MTSRILHGQYNRLSACITLTMRPLTPFLAPDWAFIVLITDGVSSILSDQEIVDVARYAKRPWTSRI